MSKTNSRPIIVQALYSFQVGGSERMAALLASEMHRRGFGVIAVAFYGSSDGPIRIQLERDGIECIAYTFEERSRLRRMFLGREIEALFHSRRVDAIHLHHGVSAVRAARAARRAGVRHVVMTEHSHAAMVEMPSYLRRVRASLKFVDHVTAVNVEIAEFLNNAMSVSLRQAAQVIPNAIDDRMFSLQRSTEARLASGLQDSFVFVYVGRLHADKDLPTLFAAFSILLNEVPLLRPMLVVAGDGPERTSLDALARTLRIDHAVQMWGMQQDVTHALSVSDAFVMSSVREGLPMALIEAMAAGLPCVATAVGSMAAVLADGRGRVVAPGDALALARAMRETVDAAGKSAAIAASARAYVGEHFSLEPVVSKYLALLGQPSRWT